MLGIVIFFTALSSTILPIIASRRNGQLDAVVKLLENQLKIAKSSSEESASGSDDAHSFVEHDLKTEDVVNLIKQANIDRHNRAQADNDRQKIKSTSKNLNRLIQSLQYKSKKNDMNNYGYKNPALDEVLEERKTRKKQRLTPNRLLSFNQYRYENEDRPETGGGGSGGLSKYSKVFVILDPIALQNSRNTEDLPSLLLRILEQSSSAVNKSHKGKRYKGFVVSDDARRRRDSKEKDEEEEYRPKRPRVDHGGGGGGGGGRTAIPYIRHRGDIYERDH